MLARTKGGVRGNHRPQCAHPKILCARQSARRDFSKLQVVAKQLKEAGDIMDGRCHPRELCRSNQSWCISTTAESSGSSRPTRPWNPKMWMDPAAMSAHLTSKNIHYSRGFLIRYVTCRQKVTEILNSRRPVLLEPLVDNNECNPDGLSASRQIPLSTDLFARVMDFLTFEDRVVASGSSKQFLWTVISCTTKFDSSCSSGSVL